VIQEWLQHVPAEPQSRVLTELQRAERAAIAVATPMAPGFDDEEVAIVSRIFRLGRCVGGRGAVDVFLIPLSVNV
jgi:hypothetical protein